MPIYEYTCKSCGFEKDALQKMSDAPLKECPECKQDSFVKRISAAAFHLSGSGWYQTDSKASKKTEKNVNSSSESTKKNNNESTQTSDPNSSATRKGATS